MQNVGDGNKRRWMNARRELQEPKNDCTSDQLPKDDYIGGLRNIGRRWHCDKACDWVDEFHIVWV